MHKSELKPEGYLYATYTGDVTTEEFLQARKENALLLEPLKSEGKKLLEIADLSGAQMPEMKHDEKLKSILADMPYDRMAILIEPGNVEKKTIIDLIIKGSEKENSVLIFTDLNEALKWLLG